MNGRVDPQRATPLQPPLSCHRRRTGFGWIQICWKTLRKMKKIIWKNTIHRSSTKIYFILQETLFQRQTLFRWTKFDDGNPIRCESKTWKRRTHCKLWSKHKPQDFGFDKPNFIQKISIPVGNYIFTVSEFHCSRDTELKTLKIIFLIFSQKILLAGNCLMRNSNKKQKKLEMCA